LESLELLAELYSQMGDSSQAYAMQRRSKEFTDSLERANKASQIADWQMKFDEQQMKEVSDRKSRWLLWGVVLAVVVVAVGGIIFVECPANARGCSNDYDCFLVHILCLL